MASEQTYSTSDLRSTAQGFKRDAARKHKWALGATDQRRGGTEGHPRPQRFNQTPHYSARRTRCEAVTSNQAGAKVNRKHDVLEGANVATSDESSGSGSGSMSDGEDMPSPVVDATIMYSFDAARGPSQGSQILNVALAQAVEKFEERETVKMVKNEYEVLDSEGESMGLTPAKKGRARSGKAKAAGGAPVADAEEDYEFV